jgi:hypothetical protein
MTGIDWAVLLSAAAADCCISERNRDGSGYKPLSSVTDNVTQLIDCASEAENCNHVTAVADIFDELSRKPVGERGSAVFAQGKQAGENVSAMRTEDLLDTFQSHSLYADCCLSH